MTKRFSILLFILLIILASSAGFVTEESRIDIVNSGAPKNSIEIIDAGPQEISVREPDWCATPAGQCSVLEFSNNPFWQTKHFKIKAKGDGVLEIAFRAQDRRHFNVRYPVYSDYKNLKINGEKVFKDKQLKKRWHDNPYIYFLPVKNGDVVDISFKYRFHPGNRDYKPYVFLSLICLLCFCFPKILLFLKQKTQRFFSADWMKTIVDFYNGINPVYRKSFWVVFIILNIVFGFHTINCMSGNHDWDSVLFKTKVTEDFYMGRYGAHLIKTILFGGQYLPILTNMLAFAGLALTAVFLGIYWKLPKKISVFIICGLLLSVQPFTLEWLYYILELPDFYIAPAVIVAGFLAAEKSAGKAWPVCVLLNLAAILFMNFGISVYPSMINTLAVVFMGRLLSDSMHWDGTKQKAKELFFIQRYALADMILAAVLYKSALIFLARRKILSETMYTIQSLPISQIPERVLECVKAAFQQLYFYQFPFMPNSITEIFLALFILLVLLILFSKTLAQSVRSKIIVKGTQLLFLFGALMATKSATMLSERPMFFEPRIDIFGLVWFRVLIAGLLLSAPQFFKNVTFAAGAVVILISSVSNLYAQRVWKSGFEAEKMMWNRMLMRLDSQQNFDPQKKYQLVQIGLSPDLRKKYYIPKPNELFSAGLLSHSYDSNWVPFRGPQYFYPATFISAHLNSLHSKDNPAYTAAVVRLKKSGVLDKAKAWPHPDSIVVYEDIILVVRDQNELEDLRHNLSEKETK